MLLLLRIQIAIITAALVVTHFSISYGHAQLFDPSFDVFFSTRNTPFDEKALVPAYSIRVTRDGTEVEIAGGFRLGLTADFAKVLKSSKKIKIVHLDSFGGRLAEGAWLFRLIKQNGLSTYVSGKCMSACTLAFAGGKERFLRRGAVIGFHQGAFRSNAETPSDTFQRPVLLEAGVDKSFVDKALRVPHDDFWTPDAQTLLTARVITNLVDGTRFAPSGDSQYSRDGFFDFIGSTPVHRALRSKLPQRYRDATNEVYDGMLKGGRQSELATTFQGRVAAMVSSLTVMASDETLAEMARVTLDQYRALRKSNATDCYIYKSRGSLSDFSQKIPKNLQEREWALQEKIVSTASSQNQFRSDQLDRLRRQIGQAFIARGSTLSQYNILEDQNLPPARHDEFCATAIMLYEAITEMSAADAAQAMRALQQKK